MKPKQVETLDVLQEWEEYVVRIGNTDFTAELLDLTAGASFSEEEADIPLTFLTDGDVARFRLRACSAGQSGYERSVAGTRKRVSRIALRDLGTFTKANLQEGRKWGVQNDQGVQAATEERRALLMRLRARGKDS